MHGEAFITPDRHCMAGSGWIERPLTRRDIELDGGEFLMGSPPTGKGFVFDNEKWAHPRRVESFAIAAMR